MKAEDVIHWMTDQQEAEFKDSNFPVCLGVGYSRLTARICFVKYQSMHALQVVPLGVV
jgi:hypothetical protein